jgi:Tol biopolymer transport system component
MAPDGASLAFVRAEDGAEFVYVISPPGSAPRRLTEGRSTVPRWSPDGAWIATFSDRDGSLQIWKIRPDGSDLQQVTTDGGGVAAWSPDGKRLAIALAGRRDPGAPGDGSSFMLRADQPSLGEALEWIPSGPTPDGNFVPNSWSPDGRWIAGQSWYGVLGILVYSVQARTFEQLTDFGEWPVWLPDSRRILFVSRGREFHVLDTRTRTTTLIYSALRDTLGPPRVTRDGRQAFFSRRVTESDVWMVNLR